MEFTGKEAVCLGIFLVVLFSVFNSWAFYVLSMCLLPLLWYCFFPYTLLWLHKMVRLELSSHVGGEMTGVAAVFSAGLQFYVWLASANSLASC